MLAFGGRDPPGKVSPAQAGTPQPDKNDPESRKAAQEWLDRWKAKEVDAAEKKRPAGHLELEKNLSSVKHMLKDKPAGVMDELGAGVSEGVTRVGQLAAGVGSYLPGNVGRYFEQRRKLYDERADIMKNYRERAENKLKVVGWSPGDAAAKGVAAVPELYNPVNKAGMAAKGINAAWHYARGYTSKKSPRDALVAAGGSLIGEKAEDLVNKGKAVAGNIVGTATEQLLDRTLPGKKDDPPAQHIPGPVRRPVYGKDPNELPQPEPLPQPAPTPVKKPGKKLSDYEPLFRADRPRPTSLAKRL